MINNILSILFIILTIFFSIYSSYNIRMNAINTYGLVIHEFDPWFNFRATEYLANNGINKFFYWFDYMSWSPLGRPVGTTIYPGMQIISVIIWNLLNKFGYIISLNDVCCYIPVWFGVFATILLGNITYVTTNSIYSAVISSCIMAIIPAHLMRSVGGGFDNESVAISALCLTFLLWTYSLSGKDDKKGSLIGILTGLAYICMVASWGGYIFVLNMIGAHAAFLIILGRFSNKLYWAYTLWYIVGTIGAIQIPVVGLTPLKSLEQLGPAAIFIGIQLLQLCEQPFFLKLLKVDPELTPSSRFKVRTKVFGTAAVIFAIIVAWLWPTGYFGPLSSRVRGLFVTHTRTGNPLVDSVAEHQPANPQAFWQFLHYACHTAPIGFIIALYTSIIKPFFTPRKENEKSTDPLVFIVLWGIVTYHFSTKMNRLMLLMGPISSVLSGIAIVYLSEYVYNELNQFIQKYILNKTSNNNNNNNNNNEQQNNDNTTSTIKDLKGHSKKKGSEKLSSSSKKNNSSTTVKSKSSNEFLDLLKEKFDEVNSLSLIKFLKTIIALFLIYLASIEGPSFYRYCKEMSVHLSHPSLMFQARLADGTVIMVDDYREAYWWLRDNTPEDSRVMAWWDYGYQITGIGNRTTIADGNTWNHEHIALLGRCLTSPEKRAHDIIQHLADYVLIWSGGGGDDLAKSPHMARIGNSVFDDICPGDPTCGQFGFYNRQMDPTPMMAESLLFKLHRFGERPGVTVDPKLFREVFTSKYRKVRIYEVVGVSQESKKFTNDPANRLCDRPGSWYCPGQYPPALSEILKKRKDFAQLEDFNRKRDEEANKYTEEYMKKMRGQ